MGRTLHLRCITDSAFNAEVAAAAAVVHLVGTAPKDCLFKALGDFEKLPDLVNGRPSYAKRGAPDTVTPHPSCCCPPRQPPPSCRANSQSSSRYPRFGRAPLSARPSADRTSEVGRPLVN